MSHKHSHSVEEICVQAEVQLRLRDWFGIYQVIAAGILLVLIGLSVYVAVSELSQPAQSVPISPIVLLVAIGLFTLSLVLRAAIFLSDRWKARFRWTFRADGVRLEGVNYRLELDWPAVQAAEEAFGVLSLTALGVTYRIPMRSFAGEAERNHLRRLLIQRLGYFARVFDPGPYPRPHRRHHPCDDEDCPWQ